MLANDNVLLTVIKMYILYFLTTEITITTAILYVHQCFEVSFLI
jgi:hypothetical protein